jgi:glutaredoxin
MIDSNNILLGAAWCGPCNQVKTFLAVHRIDFLYISIDTEEGKELAKRQGVKSIPVLLTDEKKYVGNEEIRPAVKRGDIV